ncbi:PIN/TRAM domain-containing protein [Tyzzerella sp. An114]|uniref:PIN/TRAM domain-containing protein n=1 Tax=Tyzzerella sp. An114 TaxID=1965545 RepID=UPI001FA90AE4|nr:TRAM domain-containing protein [Tyzzerella sp. An114]
MKRLLEVSIGLIAITVFTLVINVMYVSNFMNVQDFVPNYVPFIIGIIFGLIFYIVLSSYITEKIMKRMSVAEERLIKMNSKELMISVFGIFIGLVIANLIGLALTGFGPLGTGITILLNIILGFLGLRVARRKKDEITVPNIASIGAQIKGSDKKNTYAGKPKILDTSVIIDGRILDLLHTGFIEGKIIIPNFVLDELRHIADSADSLKRNRGRRGLDILNEIQKQLDVPVEIIDFNTKENLEVDIKLLKMAEKIDAFVMTNDFNLNKVAEFQGVKVLNINELANAIKPVVLPGEEMTVTVIKAGKENGQGIGYLNDGTMIVVEGGNKFIGETMNVVVTSVLQTAAGRMIFTKIIGPSAK